jgi:endogenous inhibitor of DNA gyrase (YacG/DUF329 family)
MMIRPATCPICQKPLVQPDGSMPATDPFCSKRCQQADLYRWMTGKYAIVEELSPEQLAENMLLDQDPEAQSD